MSHNKGVIMNLRFGTDFVNGNQEHSIPWVNCGDPEYEDTEGSCYYEYKKELHGTTTHEIRIDNWTRTPHGGFFITIIDVRENQPQCMNFECGEWLEVCIILRALAF